MIDILEFLMSNEVIIKAMDSDKLMTADAMYELEGEFVVYKSDSSFPEDLYRGSDFDEALKILLEK